MKLRKVIFATVLTIVFASGPELSAQEQVQLSAEKVLELSLYRGIVDITTYNSNKLEIVHEMYDYDIFDETSELVLFEETYQNRKELDLFSSGDTLHIRNNSSRELQYVQLNVPENLELVINVNHYGQIKVERTIRPVQVEVFNGNIEIKEAHSSISGIIIREGDIEVFSYSDSKNTSIALSTYDGNVTLNSSAKNLTAILKSDLGEIVDKTGMTIERTRKIEFEQVENEERETIEAFWYKGKLGNGRGPNLLITNTHGDIILRHI